jgi:hypothetical protein
LICLSVVPAEMVIGAVEQQHVADGTHPLTGLYVPMNPFRSATVVGCSTGRTIGVVVTAVVAVVALVAVVTVVSPHTRRRLTTRRQDERMRDFIA